MLTRELVHVISGLEQTKRDDVLLSLRQKVRSYETYEIATWLFGWAGLNRLYLGQASQAVTRIMIGLTTITLMFTGLSLVSVELLAAALVSLCLQLGMWGWDVQRGSQQVDAYHGRIGEEVRRLLERDSALSECTKGEPEPALVCSMI